MPMRRLIGALRLVVLLPAVVHGAQRKASPAGLVVQSWLNPQTSAPPAPQHRPLRVIGAGLGRTSTDSLRLALDALDYRTYHMSECFTSSAAPALLNEFAEDGDTEKLRAVLDEGGYDATVDFPLSIWYRELLALNASAKVILSVRDSADVWAASFATTIGSRYRVPGPLNFGKPPLVWFAWFRSLHALVDTVYARIGVEFGPDGDATRASARRVYDEWNAQVIATVPADQLLVFNAKEGWPPLCAFLGVEPDRCAALGPYPHANSREAMLRMFHATNFASAAFPYAAAALGVICLRCITRRRRPREQRKAKGE